MLKNGCVILIVLAANAFSAGWYARGKGYEKCMNTEDGFLICRENFVNDFCYGKERMWTNHGRGRVWYHTGQEREWFDRKLISVRNLNHKCEYHGWSRFRVTDDKWAWQCYLNNNATQDDDCRGFRKR
ncbi:MAG: hypothetical protein FWH22_00145 [Fibromonadales bacterium]|nr:hypothetical protein [Fibromonadales bacterium]